MPVTIGSALSIHGIDNARISANGRFFILYRRWEGVY